MAVKNYLINDKWLDIDKQNLVEVKSTDGVIESVKVNSEEYGGGGSGGSDFSTAKVTITTATTTGVLYLPYITQLMGVETSHAQISIGNQTATAILYKGNTVLTCSAELYNQANVSGNAQKVTTQNGFGYIKISGDCAITFGSIS